MKVPFFPSVCPFECLKLIRFEFSLFLPRAVPPWTTINRVWTLMLFFSQVDPSLPAFVVVLGKVRTPLTLPALPSLHLSPSPPPTLGKGITRTPNLDVPLFRAPEVFFSRWVYLWPFDEPH